jgi:hypothetical protein
MVLCKCGKHLDKVPDWLQSVNVEFVCNNCPNRKTKNIAFISLEPVQTPDLGPETHEAEGEAAAQLPEAEE